MPLRRTERFLGFGGLRPSIGECHWVSLQTSRGRGERYSHRLWWRQVSYCPRYRVLGCSYEVSWRTSMINVLLRRLVDKRSSSAHWAKKEGKNRTRTKRADWEGEAAKKRRTFDSKPNGRIWKNCPSTRNSTANEDEGRNESIKHWSSS